MAILYEMGDGSDEYTALATCAIDNSVTYVLFSNLDPEYGYSLEYYIPDGTASNAYEDITVPTYTKIQRMTNSDGTINLKYILTGAQSGTDQFKLRIKR